MIGTIGLAIAFSPTAGRMLAEAFVLSQKFYARLVLIHVGDHEAKEEQLMASLLSSRGLTAESVTIRWENGDPAKVILRVCGEENVDLLVAGALKKENLLQYYLGTIARKIIRKASCSVLLLTQPSGDPKGFSNIVVDAEDNPIVKKTISLGCQLGQENHAWIHVVRELKMYGLVMSASDQCTEEEYEGMRQTLVKDEIEKVERLLQSIPHRNLKVNIKVVSGKSGFELAQFAKRKDADLLIVTAPPRKFKFFDRVFTHDLEYILADLPCNLMIVHPGKEVKSE